MNAQRLIFVLGYLRGWNRWSLGSIPHDSWKTNKEAIKKHINITGQLVINHSSGAGANMRGRVDTTVDAPVPKPSPSCLPLHGEMPPLPTPPSSAPTPTRCSHQHRRS